MPGSCDWLFPHPLGACCFSRVSGIGEDTLFLGVLELLPARQDVATVWVLPSGTIFHSKLHGRHKLSGAPLQQQGPHALQPQSMTRSLTGKFPEFHYLTSCASTPAFSCLLGCRFGWSRPDLVGSTMLRLIAGKSKETAAAMASARAALTQAQQQVWLCVHPRTAGCPCSAWLGILLVHCLLQLMVKGSRQSDSWVRCRPEALG
jgi:hypothetical protein